MTGIGLILDTSTERGLVALGRGSEIIAEERLPVGVRNSSALMPTVARVLEVTGLSPEDLHCLVVTVGPGSYTGIRVGVAAAKGMAYALGIPLVGVCVLDGFYPFPAIIDAKIGGGYFQRPGEEPRLVPLEELPRELQKMEQIHTSKAEPLRSRLPKDLKVRWKETYPSAQALWDKGRAKWREGAFSTDGSLELLYLRKTQAELERAG